METGQDYGPGTLEPASFGALGEFTEGLTQEQGSVGAARGTAAQLVLISDVELIKRQLWWVCTTVGKFPVCRKLKMKHLLI